jgi:hypothetical protein
VCLKLEFTSSGAREAKLEIVFSGAKEEKYLERSERIKLPKAEPLAE